MGWSIGYDATWKRDIGYGVPATCDHPGCGAEIDRGLSYVCGSEPYGGDKGCGLYFCGDHQQGRYQRCRKCAKYAKTTFKPTPDVSAWIEHKLNDESWARWRHESPKEVEYLLAQLAVPPVGPLPTPTAK
jgi:hypothetical protein